MSECEGRAVRQANAAARRAPTKAIKAQADGSLRILAVPFAGPFGGMDGKGRDSDGEYFSERTDLAIDWFPSRRPLLWHHGMDDEGPGISAVGHVDVSTAEKTAEGWWVTAWLDKHHQYFKQIGELLEQDAVYGSTAAMPHLVRKANDGEILRWPWVELSLTPTPSNLFATVEPATAKAHYKAAGLTPPPTIDPDETRSYGELLDRLSEEVGECVDLTRRLADGRHKVGRALSAPRRSRLESLMTRLREGADELAAILDETRPMTAADPASGEAAEDDATEDAVTGAFVAEQSKAAPASAEAQPDSEPTPTTEQDAAHTSGDSDLERLKAHFLALDTRYRAEATQVRGPDGAPFTLTATPQRLQLHLHPQTV